MLKRNSLLASSHWLVKSYRIPSILGMNSQNNSVLTHQTIIQKPIPSSRERTFSYLRVSTLLTSAKYRIPSILRMSLLSGNALVTGAGELSSIPAHGYRTEHQFSGSGIGRQLSLAYVKAGIQNITLADINPAGIEETAKLINARFPAAGILQVTVDVTDESSVNGMVEQAVEAFGTLECGEPQFELGRYLHVAC